MNIPEIVPVDADGYCDLETGECVTTDVPSGGLLPLGGRSGDLRASGSGADNGLWCPVDGAVAPH
jgi:hypothetical protein